MMKKLLLAAACMWFAAASFTAKAQIVSTYTGDGSYAVTNGPLATAQLQTPRGICTDPSGNTYFTDGDNNVIRKIDLSGNVTTFAGTPGPPSTVDGTGPAARFDSPSGICSDASGNIYVAQPNTQSIRMITPAGVVSTLVSGGGLVSPYDVCCDNAGNVYAADQDARCIFMITPAGAISLFAGMPGQFGLVDGPRTTAKFIIPSHICTDAAGNFYVFDACAIRKISTSGIVSTVAGSATPGTADGIGSAAQFRGGGDLVADNRGVIYLCDGSAQTIRRVSPTGTVTTIAGAPLSLGFWDGPGAAARFSYPDGIALDASGNILICDTYNNRIRKLIPSGESLHFDGNNDYVQVDGSLSSMLDNLSGMTVEAWVYPTTTTGLGVIIGDYSTGVNSNMHFLLRRDGDTYTFWTSDGVFYSVSTAPGTVQPNTWQHVCGVLDGSNYTMNIYVNGVLQASQYGDPYTGPTTNPVWIGNNALGEAFQGQIDEVRFWNRALCPNEIPYRMNGEISGAAPGLMLNYHFNAGTSGQDNTGITNLVNDVTNGASYNASLYNFALNGTSSNWVAPGAVTGSVPADLSPYTFTATAYTQSPYCYGQNNGNVSLIPSVSNDVYTFNWTQGQGTSDGYSGMYNATAGIFICEITNSCGRTNIDTVILTQPDSIIIAASITNVSCNGGSNGGAALSAAGGTVNSNGYEYVWWYDYYNYQTRADLPAGTYTVSVNDAHNCSGVRTITITEPPAITNTVTTTACDPYTHGIYTYHGSGVYTEHLTAANGCDSALTLNLTINHPSYSSVSATACNQYVYNGNTYTASGTYMDTLTNAAGCDSIVTLNLTMLNSSSVLNVSNCGNYTLNGTNYTSSGTYTQTLTNAAGCDSTITLNLTVGTPSSSMLMAVACDSYTLNGIPYTAGGIYTQTLSNATGCDSTITLNLMLKQSSASSLTQTACNNYTLNGTTYTASGTYTQVIPNAMGCDSTITLSLTVNTVDASATQNGGTFTANAAGLSYQWVDCDSGNQPLNGQTGQSFTPQYNGLYAVVVNDGTCSATSNCFYINNVGLQSQEEIIAVNVFPNPSTGVFTVDLEKDAAIRVTNALGAVIIEKELKPGTNAIDLGKESSGVYFMTIKAEGRMQTIKLVKQN
jgi:sugar lactone lactonase YvrE